MSACFFSNLIFPYYIWLDEIAQWTILIQYYILSTFREKTVNTGRPCFKAGFFHLSTLDILVDHSLWWATTMCCIGHRQSVLSSFRRSRVAMLRTIIMVSRYYQCCISWGGAPFSAMRISAPKCLATSLDILELIWDQTPYLKIGGNDNYFTYCV